MNIAQIEDNLQNLVQSFSKETFIYDLLSAYGFPKASITRLQQGALNLSKVDGEIDWKKKLFYKPAILETPQELLNAIKANQKALKHEPRFIVVTDYETLLAIDTKTDDSLDIPLLDIPQHFDFFLPWAGMEKAQYKIENPADVKAAEKMAKLFDGIKKDNPDNSPEFIHGLNVFLSRLLFCYFAEDTGIFKENQFTNAIISHTQTDGSDLHTYLDAFFDILNISDKQRNSKTPKYLTDFPYVNGGLFKQKFPLPQFTRRSRQVIIDCGEMQWKEINPDIFGSMFQAVISEDQRGSLGQHYTSVPNIMKVIEPLFLNDLYEAFEKAKGDKRKLNDLLIRISKIKIFDPACGSGNFLIIAYKELRKLEMLIIKEVGTLALSHISLGNFYGIELDDFAHEIAQLSLWLAEHQMNVEYLNQFGQTNPTLPLREAGHIVQGNACRIDWDKVCPKNECDEVYILGNPPYLGSSLQNAKQKEDMAIACSSLESYKNLDYIACWFIKGAKYIKNEFTRSAFVTTNSINQGEQIALLWPYILKLSVEIGFAHKSFKWTNNAKSNAGVTCTVVGLQQKSNKTKQIYNNGICLATQNINAYLTNASNIIIKARRLPLSKLPTMLYGNKPADGGNLILTYDEYKKLIDISPNAYQFIKSYVGSDDFINGFSRYCIWVDEISKNEANQIPFFSTRFNAVKEFRLKSPKAATVKLASTPFQFAEKRYSHDNSILIPSHSSENRNYIPIGYAKTGAIITNSAQAIYDAESWVFSMLNSKSHMIWVRMVCGSLETRIRYSSSLGYNTFPFPLIIDKQKEELSMCTFRILEEREKHSEKTLAQLYDADKMPEGLREAHHLNDLAIERCYRSKPFESDEERLAYLFKLYEQMIEEEQNRGTLFAGIKKGKRKKNK